MNGTDPKFTEQQVIEIKRRLKLHHDNCPKTLVKEYGVEIHVIYGIKGNLTYKKIN